MQRLIGLHRTKIYSAALQCVNLSMYIINAVSQFQNGNEDFDDQWLIAVNYKEESVNASLTVNEHDVSFQLDSAAKVNTICHKHVRKHQVSPTTVRLNMWNKTNLKPLGKTVLMVVNPRTCAKSKVKFAVVPNGFTNLFWLKTIQELGFITINKKCFISQIKADRKGCNCSGPVSEPTVRVSQMTVVHKPIGKLRICIDPQPLNAALKREHYKLPVFDDLLPKLNFSVSFMCKKLIGTSD